MSFENWNRFVKETIEELNQMERMNRKRTGRLERKIPYKNGRKTRQTIRNERKERK